MVDLSMKIMGSRDPEKELRYVKVIKEVYGEPYKDEKAT